MASIVMASQATVQLSSSFLPKATQSLGQAPVDVAVSRPVLSAPRAQAQASSETISRREVSLSAAAALIASAIALPARADFEEKYTAETKAVIEKVRSTLALDKADPNRSDAVNELRELSNDWVAKYRREKTVAGRPSFSNMYSVLNAISGHYVSFGVTYPIPKKRQDRIFEEVEIAEKALSRGR